MAIVGVVVVHRSGRPAPPDARAAGVAVVVGDTVYLTDGRRVTLPLPEGGSIGQLEIVPAGYLYSYIVLAAGGPASLRLASSDEPGSYQDLGLLGDSQYHVAPDGRTALVTAIDAQYNETIAAIDLATGKRRVEKAFDASEVIDVAGDWALLRNDDGPNDARATALWNYRSGAVVTGADPTATEYRVFASGAVLRGVDVPGVDEVTAPLPSCYAVVATADFASTIQTGYCGTQVIKDAWLSPTGDWVLAIVAGTPPDAGDTLVMLRVTDLAAGRWAPVALDPSASMSAATFWDSPTSVVTSGDDDYLRCTTAGTCTDLHLPTTDMIAPTIGTTP